MRLVNTEPAPESPVAGGVAAGADYRGFDAPTIIRKQPDKAGSGRPLEEDSDYHDIPAFLRRQAD